MVANRKLKHILADIFYSIVLIPRRKVFCISIQRNGTTSWGKFMKDHGYRVAGYGENAKEWSYNWQNGQYNKIFRSLQFKGNQAFEDNPWWAPGFFKYLYHRFPKAKFVLFYRDSGSWYRSMLRHSGGKNLGNTYRHCLIYNRLPEFYDKFDNDPDFSPSEKDVDNLLDMTEMSEHYTTLYDTHTREVMEFFKNHDSKRLLACELNDDNKWQKLGKFLNIKVKNDYNAHLGKTSGLK